MKEERIIDYSANCGMVREVTRVIINGSFSYLYMKLNDETEILVEGDGAINAGILKLNINSLHPDISDRALIAMQRMCGPNWQWGNDYTMRKEINMIYFDFRYQQQWEKITHNYTLIEYRHTKFDLILKIELKDKEWKAMFVSEMMLVHECVYDSMLAYSFGPSKIESSLIKLMQNKEEKDEQPDNGLGSKDS